MENEDELTNVTFKIYLHLVKTDEPTGPRDIMRALDITSPGVVHRHLQKLADLGWVNKDEYGRYSVKQKVGFKGYVWVGKHLASTSILFAFGFICLFVFLLVVLGAHLVIGSPIEESFFVLAVVTLIAGIFFLIEGLIPRKKTPKE